MTPRSRVTLSRHQILILVLASVMVGSFFLLVMWPKQQELSALGSAVETERRRVEVGMRTSRTGVYVAARLPEMRRARAHLDARLPEAPEVASVLAAMAERLDAEPAVRHSVQRSGEAVEGPVPAVPLRLSLEGAFPSVYRCLGAIESLERLCRFSDLAIERLEDGRTRASGLLLVYYLPPEGAEANRSTALPPADCEANEG